MTTRVRMDNSGGSPTVLRSHQTFSHSSSWEPTLVMSPRGDRHLYREGTLRHCRHRVAFERLFDLDHQRPDESR